MNVLSHEKRHQIELLGKLGWRVRRIAAQLGTDRATVKSYLRSAGLAVRPPGRPGSNPAISGLNPITGSGAPNPAISTPNPITGFVPGPPSKCEPYRERIEEALSRGRTAMSVWQELRDEGFTGGYQSVRRFTEKLRGKQTPEARCVIVTAPGEEAQVDWGTGPLVRNPATGKYRRTRLFVLTLGHSRKCVRFLAWKSGSKVWAELHERAFRRLGGAPRTLVLDNLKEGVEEAHWYDPEMNPLYRDVLKHYGVVALPARVRDPDRKGKVERGVGHAQLALKGLKFDSLEEAQGWLDRWETNWADTRIHGTLKRQVKAMFEEERPHLLPLPPDPFRYYEHGIRAVHLDGHVEVSGAYYSVPPGRIGERLNVQWDSRTVRILDPRTGELLREHLRESPGRRRTAEADRPARTPVSTHDLLRRAAAAGTAVGEVAREIHRRDGEAGVRRIMGIFQLRRKYGPVAAEAAAKAALECGVPSYRFLKNWLEHQGHGQLTLKQVDPLIRELTHYRDVIARMTNETPTEEKETHEHP